MRSTHFGSMNSSTHASSVFSMAADLRQADKTRANAGVLLSLAHDDMVLHCKWHISSNVGSGEATTPLSMSGGCLIDCSKGCYYYYIGIVGPQLPLTLLLHPLLIHLLCWKRACTRVFQQRACTRVFQQRACTRVFQQRACTRVFQQRACTRVFQQRACTRVFQQRACTRVFQQRQQSTESTLKMIPSVLSWAGNVYHWQWIAMGPGDQRH